MGWDLTCTECGKDFEETDDLSWADVQCPHCKIWLEMDFEEDWDNVYRWVVGKSDDQSSHDQPGVRGGV